MPTLVHVTDLHLDHWPQNLDAMLEQVADIPADFYLVGGDNGGEAGLTRTIEALRQLRPDAPIGWIMGNHDLWGRHFSALWEDHSHFPATYLETGNLELDYCTVVGTYGHYDYTAGDPNIPIEIYRSYRFAHMVWNDRHIVRDEVGDPEIAEQIAQQFQARYAAAVERGLPIVVVTHTWPFLAPEPSKRSFVTAYCANPAIGQVLFEAPQPPALLVAGHIHRPYRTDEHGFPAINTGSDYRAVRVTRWDLE